MTIEVGVVSYVGGGLGMGHQGYLVWFIVYHLSPF